MRYSRKFRIFAGLTCFISGVLNYGIFPQITANFFVNYCGLPESFFVGGVAVSTRMLIMLIFVAIGLFLVLGGGLLTVLLTDFLQGLLMNICVLVVIGYLVFHFGWGNMVDVIQQAPAGKSMIDPFDQGGVDSFTWVFFMMMLFLQIYSRGVWQGSSAGNTAARTPHEGRMAGILGQWRQTINYLLLLIVPLAAYTLMHSPDWTATAANVQVQIDGLADVQMQKQLLVPIAISHILPIGLLGIFAVLFFMAAVTTDSSYLHSWGSIFVQDVLIPLRKKPLNTAQHILWLRLSILGVGCFVFCWSLWFPLKEYLFMYTQITGAVFLGGAGAAVIGGLYWKRGTVAGAWTGMILGAFFAVAGVVTRSFWGQIPLLAARWPTCPFNGMQMSVFAALIAISGYVLVSLLTRNPPEFEMDKLLHRGKYDEKGEHKQTAHRSLWDRTLGITADFTKGDRRIYYFNIGWALVLLGLFLTGAIARLFVPIGDRIWMNWWNIYLCFLALLAVITAVWFFIGGFRDFFALFRLMRSEKVDEKDDGRVG